MPLCPGKHRSGSYSPYKGDHALMRNNARPLPVLPLATALLGVLSVPAVAQTAPPASSPAPARPVAQKSGWVFFGNWRLRPEIWSWFGTSKGQTDYTYIGSLLRFGFSRQTSQEDILVE